jgi:hypothetical protein
MATIEIYAKPSNLYRYRPLGPKLDQEVDALLDGYIFCPLFSEMNDPMEGSHRVSQRLFGASIDSKRQEAVDIALATTGIASMSEVSDHEPMGRTMPTSSAACACNTTSTPCCADWTPPLRSPR